jgi:hypothetical protein
MSNNSSTAMHVLLAMVTFLVSHCLAMIGGYTHRLLGRSYDICGYNRPSFVKIVSVNRGDKQTDKKIT